MVIVKPEEEVIRKRMYEMKLDRLRARAKNKILSYILLKIKEGVPTEELENIISKLIVNNIHYIERISTFLNKKYYCKKDYNSWDIQKERKKLHEEKKMYDK